MLQNVNCQFDPQAHIGEALSMLHVGTPFELFACKDKGVPMVGFFDDVEAAASLVQEAAHPDANIIFGAAFDETMDDEIRVTVIATRFDETPVHAFKTEETKRSGLYSEAAEKKEAETSRKAAQQAQAAESVPDPVVPEQPEKQPEKAADPFDDIFKIFNSKN